MKARDFLMCKFQGDPNTHYIADITHVNSGNITCKFVHSGSIYDFETTTWTVARPGKTFPVGTRLTEHVIYTKSDWEEFPMPGNESKMVCVTFEDNNRYLGHLTHTGIGIERHVTFLHSGAKYLFSNDNEIIQSGGAYPAGGYILSMEIYRPEDPAEITFSPEEGSTVEAEPGSLHTAWREYFQNYNMEHIQSGILYGKEILQKMVDTTVAKAKLISHAFANPIEGKELVNGGFKAAFSLLIGNEAAFIKHASKSFIGVFVGSFAEILRANEAREISKTRQGFYKAYADGCFRSIYGGPSFSKPADPMEQSFYDLGFQTASNLTPRADLPIDSTITEYSRADLLVASVEAYRTRPGQLDQTYSLDVYLRCLSDSSIPYQGFLAKLSSYQNRTDD